MLEEKIVEIVETCLDAMRRIKNCSFELQNIEQIQMLSGDKSDKDKRMTYVHLKYKEDSFKVLMIFPLDLDTNEEQIEKVSKDLIEELNKARKDIDSGKEYEPTCIETLKRLLHMSDYFGGFGGWYM